MVAELSCRSLISKTLWIAGKEWRERTLEESNGGIGQDGLAKNESLKMLRVYCLQVEADMRDFLIFSTVFVY